MTGYEIFKTSCSFMAETPSEKIDLEPFALTWLNLLLSEALPYENANRIANNRQVLKEAPLLKELAEEVPYCAELCRIALPYGLASYLLMEDESYGLSQDFRNRYLSAMYEAAPLVCEKTVDVYGGEG